MSRLTEFHFYDQALLEHLVRGFRAAKGKRAAIHALVASAPEPPMPPKHRRALRARLALLRRQGAPELTIEIVRRELEPKRLLMERVQSRERVSEGDLMDLAARGRRPIPESYEFLSWLADAPGRAVEPEREGRPWIERWTSRNDGVREALFGAHALCVDGGPALGEPRAWVHQVSGLPRVRAFFQEILDRAPPPLSDYRRWYPELHALRFGLDDGAAVPADGPLSWEYARELARAARAIEAIVAMLAGAARRRWCIQVAYE